jgi:hypothetical protein
MHSPSRFLQGVLPFEGKGLDQPAPPAALWLAAPAGVTGTVIVGLGLVEV